MGELLNPYENVAWASRNSSNLSRHGGLLDRFDGMFGRSHFPADLSAHSLTITPALKADLYRNEED